MWRPKTSSTPPPSLHKNACASLSPSRILSTCSQVGEQVDRIREGDKEAQAFLCKLGGGVFDVFGRHIDPNVPLSVVYQLEGSADVRTTWLPRKLDEFYSGVFSNPNSNA